MDIFKAIDQGGFKARRAVEEEIEKDPDIVKARNFFDETPLHRAVAKGDLGITKLLVMKGADVNAKDDSGNTPLHWAADGETETVEFLIGEGADVNAKNQFDETPLHRAALEGKPKTAEILLENGADINAKNRFDETPLCYLRGYRGKFLRNYSERQTD